MSLETWKKEFYPSPASSFRKKSWLEAAEHSLKKWKGLREENCDKHNVELDQVGDVVDSHNFSDSFLIDSGSCALCVRSARYNGDFLSNNCKICPLAKTLGRSCGGINDGSIFEKYVENGDPEPMILALEKTVQSLLEEREK